MPYLRHPSLLLICSCLFSVLIARPVAADEPPIIMGQPTPGGQEFPYPVPDTIAGLHCAPITYDFDYEDPDSGVGAVVFGLASGDPGTIDSDGVYTFVPSFSQIDVQFEITVSACRPVGNCTEATVLVRVINDAPVVTSTCDTLLHLTAGSSETIDLDIFESCPTDPLNLFVVDDGGLSTPPTVDAGAQQLTIVTTGADLGLYTILVAASDTRDTSMCPIQVNVPGDNAITLDSTAGFSNDSLVGGQESERLFRVTVDAGLNSYLTGYSNGFRIYSPDGARWDTTYQAYLPAWPRGAPDGFDNTALAKYGLDGLGDDTLTVAGLVFFSDRGALPGYDSVAWSIAVQPTQTLLNHGRTICIDTVYAFPPSNIWLWNDSTLKSYAPRWDGPYCFSITSEGCCAGMTGNVNNDPGDVVSLTDLTLLVNHLFVTFEPLACRPEANTSGDSNCDITLTDLTQLVNHLFVTFDPLANCIEFDEENCY